MVRSWVVLRCIGRRRGVVRPCASCGSFFADRHEGDPYGACSAQFTPWMQSPALDPKRPDTGWDPMPGRLRVALLFRSRLLGDAVPVGDVPVVDLERAQRQVVRV